MQLKIANWNIEWMNRWFTADRDGAPEVKAYRGANLADTEAFIGRVAGAIKDLDCDILTVQEGPTRHSEMALFVDRFLEGDYDVVGPVGGHQQRLFALIRRSSPAITAVHQIDEEFGVDFDETWEADVNGDMITSAYGFTRPPLVIAITVHGGQEIRVINLHAKSKFVRMGKRLWNGTPAERQEFIEAALLARRRISTEIMRMRTYLDLCLTEDPAAGLVVTGDLNDGINLDMFERRYLSHDIASQLAGSPFRPHLMLRHAFVDLMDADDNYTAIFDNFVSGENNQKILLDHILVSANLFWDQHKQRNAVGQIEHEIFKAHSVSNAPIEHFKEPSDHRPQSVTIQL